MKKDLKAVVTAAALALSLAMAPTVSVMAAATGNSQTIEGFASPDSPTTVTDSTGTQAANLETASIDVQASVLGSSQKIIYSISISYGDMQFAYDFGQTWDPVSHTYTNNGSGVSEGGWVTTGHVNGSNNAIMIQNDSNYPVTVSLSYTYAAGTGSGTLFNSDPNAENSVIGIFSDDNDTLKTNVNTANYNGKLSNTADKTALTSPTFDLDMCQDGLISTDVDYGVLNTSNTNSKVYSKTLYFTLCGTPDATTTLTSNYEAVGSIKVKVTPADSSKVAGRS